MLNWGGSGVRSPLDACDDRVYSPPICKVSRCRAVRLTCRMAAKRVAASGCQRAYADTNLTEAEFGRLPKYFKAESLSVRLRSKPHQDQEQCSRCHRYGGDDRHNQGSPR